MAKSTAFGIDGEAKEIVELIEKMGYKHSSWKVFEDFVAMAAISISNAVDWVHKEKRETQYMEIVGRYTKEEIDNFPQMLAHLVTELENGLDDVLGKVYHALELHNKYKGQFFTPMHICTLMGKMALGEHDKIIEEKGYVSICEPCCGAGALILGFAQGMKDSGYNYQKQMVVTATDIDLKCVHMCYLQLALFHIPAVVIHGDTIAMKEWSRWYTPAYMLDGWLWRQTCGNDDKTYAEDEALKVATDPMYGAIKKTETVLAETETPLGEQPKYDVELKVNQNGQLSLF